MTLKSPIALPALTLILAGLFMLLVGTKDTYTYLDEVFFADPAVNYVKGDGYTTTAWYVTRQGETHVSTAPAYSLLLIGWLKLFGVTQTAVRSLPPALALGSAWLFWLAVRRAGGIKSGLAGAVLIAVLLLDYGYAFSYTCARPDALSVLLVAGMGYAFTLANRRLALAVVGGIALLLPLVQWGCVIYVGVLAVALWLIFGKKVLPFVVVAGVGLAAGLLFQKILYQHLGVWDAWVATIKSEGSESIFERVRYRLTPYALRHHYSNALPKDYSMLVALVGLALVYLWSRLRRWQAGVHLAKSAWIIALVVTTGMYLLGKFPTYYGWMLAVPVAVVLATLVDQAPPPAGRWGSRFVVLIAVLAGVVGLPMQIFIASHDWQERNPAAINAWLGPKIKPDDVVFCDYPFYYTAKERARQVFVGRYMRLMTPADLDRITLVVASGKPNASDWLKPGMLTPESLVGSWVPARGGLFGNRWASGFLSAPNYRCEVYRLKEPGTPPGIEMGGLEQGQK